MTNPKRRRGRRDQAARLALAPLVATGRVRCYRCDNPILPGQPWDADHLHALAQGGDPAGQVVPSHRSCNRHHGLLIATGHPIPPPAGARLRPSDFLEAASPAETLPPHFSPPARVGSDPEPARPDIT